MPRNAHPDSTFSSHLHNDWTLAQLDQIDSFSAGDDFAATKGGYARQMPTRFDDERDDRLMNSLISNYALEMKDGNGKPSGHFFFDRDAARAVSEEVVGTHFKWDPTKTAKFLDEKFGGVYDHFDVNNDSIVEVERMPQFLRYLLGNSLEIGLQ